MWKGWLTLLKEYKTLSILLIFLFIFLGFNTVSAVEVEEDLDWRMDLIIASQNLDNHKQLESQNFNNLGVVFTTFGDEKNLINTGVRYAPVIYNVNNKPIRFMGELFYMTRDAEAAGFLSLSFEPFKNIYFGAGGALTDRADYQAFVGYNISESIFLELRAIDENKSEIETYPFFGLQMQF